MPDDPPSYPVFHGTTILAVRRGDEAVLAGDGQVTLQHSIMKHSARKVRRLHDEQIIVGFAGATADAMALFEKLEEKLKEYNASLTRAAVELAKLWRTDKYLRHLEALLIAVSAERTLLISGNGDEIEPDENIASIGSGSTCALAAAKALYDNTDLSASEIAGRAMKIASSIDIYTNDQIVIEKLEVSDQ